MSPPQAIGFVGDIHCGSHAGLWPVDELPADTSLRPGCRYLMQCWEHLIETWPKLDLLVLMGDLIDGKQQKSSGVGLFTTDLAEQSAAAAKVLKRLVDKTKPTKIFRVWGTPYHESHDNVLAIVDGVLNVNRVEQVIDLKLGKHILNIAHHPASGAAIYQGTVVDREGLWSMIAAREGKLPDCRWIVRAHKHNWFHIETRHKDVMILPCWQLPTAHAIKQNYWRFQPDIGSVLMLADTLNDSGYRFVPTLYDAPTKSIAEWDQL